NMLMETYLCYFSVRLGVIFVAVLTIFRCMALSVSLLMMGVKVFDPLIDLFEHDAEYKDGKYVRKFINWIENSPEGVSVILQLICFAHMGAAILSIWGAIKVLKWLQLPLTFFEFVYFISFTILHIVLMIMLKKQINLGFLIILTLVGCFYILFVGYNVNTCVSMFQIISLVKSHRYCELYGDQLSQRTNHSREMIVLSYPVLNIDDMRNTYIDKQKRIRKLSLTSPRNPPRVSVIPVKSRYPQPHLKWWQQQALETIDDKMQDSAIYCHWQPGELKIAVGGNTNNSLDRRCTKLCWH
ncbi:hypothetical protein KR009_003826, partial [Drosophila setifemur]